MSANNATKRFGGSGGVDSTTRHNNTGNFQIRKNTKLSYNLSKDFKFKCLDDVKAYLSEDLVECLICGVKRKSLNTHFKVHGITSKEYKRMFGIPISYGVAGVSTKSKLADAVKNFRDANPDLAAQRDENSRKWASSGLQESDNSYYHFNRRKTITTSCKKCGEKITQKDGYKKKTFCSKKCSNAYTFSHRSRDELGRLI